MDPAIAGYGGFEKHITHPSSVFYHYRAYTASRMESHSAGGSIQVTEATYDLIKDEYICEPRGTIQIKGKGEMPVWFVIKKR